jgi:hypothetical protein
LHIDFLSWHLLRPVLVGVAQWRARLLVLRFYFCVEEYYLASTRQHSVRCVLVILHGMFRDPDEGVRREDSLRNQRFFFYFVSTPLATLAPPAPPAPLQPRVLLPLLPLPPLLLVPPPSSVSPAPSILLPSSG